MLYRDISRILALILLGFCGSLLVPLSLAAYYQFLLPSELHPQPHSTLYFLETLLITLALTIALFSIGRRSTGMIFRREGLAIVVVLWVLLPALSALPFYLSGVLENPFMAYFESVSGLTTTGATVMQAKVYNQENMEIPIVKTFKGVIDTTYSYFGTITPIRNPATGKVIAKGLDALSPAILFWRSFIQWLGGGGIIVLFVAILPALGAGGKVLFQTEVPGPIKGTATPRIKETAINLWYIYLGLTVIIFGLVYFANQKMSVFDAITITFAALSTGGFSVHESNIGFYNSASTDWAVIIGMLLGSINFAVYYYIWKGKLFKIFKPELLLYGAILFIACSIATVHLMGTPDVNLVDNTVNIYDFPNALRDGTFQIVSAITTSGFSTTNYDEWPYVVQASMLIVMFVGGMSGSTAGGIKIMRHYMLFRIAQFKVESLFRPHTVRKFKVDGREVDEGASSMVLTFFLLVITISVAGTFFFILDGIDPETALGAVTCMINCTGVAFRMGGPLDSFAFMSNFSLFLSSLLMIMGRLEFFAVLAVLVPAFWHQDK